MVNAIRVQRRIALAVIFLCLCLGVARVHAAGEQAGRISGSVIEAASGAPVPGATVTVSGPTMIGGPLTLTTSDDGTTWRPLATGTSTGQLTNVNVPPTRARYVRITSNSTSGHWWTLADVCFYH